MDFHLQCWPEAIFFSDTLTLFSRSITSGLIGPVIDPPKQLRLQRARLRSERLRLAERKLSGNHIRHKPRMAVQNWLPKKFCQALWHMQGLICGAFRKRAPRRSFDGSSGKGHRFVEPMRCDDSVVASCDVEWVRNGQKLERGGRPTYFKRVQGLAGDLGIARGFSSLGVRKPRSSNQGASLKRTWRATGSPCEWNATVLSEELTHAGPQNVKVLSRKSWGKQVEWWVEATAKDHDFFEISTASRFVVVIATPVSKLKRQTVKKLASGERVLFSDPRKIEEEKPGVVKTAGRSFYIGTPLKQKEVQATLIDSTPGTPKGESMGGEARNNSEKRQGETPAKDRPTKRPAVMSKPPHGLKARTNPGAGNCVFEALGQGLGPDQPKPARSVRASTINNFETACRTLSTMAGTKGAYE